MFLQKLKLSNNAIVMVLALLGVMTFAGMPAAYAQVRSQDAAQTVEGAIQDVDPANQDSANGDAGAKKLFHPKSTASSTAKKTSKDFMAQHKSPKNAEASVQSGDLMDAMRQNLNPAPAAPEVLVPAPTDTTQAPEQKDDAAPARKPKVAAGQHMIKPLSAGKLFHPAGKAASDVSAEVNDVLPDVTPKADAASSFTPPVPVAASKPAAPIATIDQPTKEPKKEEPKKDTAKTGAPLLSDLSEPPSGVEDVKSYQPASEKKVESAPAAPVSEPAKQAEAAKQVDAAPVYSQPRRLFSAANDNRKRPGVSRVVQADSFFHAPIAAPVVPDAAPVAKEPMIKPVPSDVVTAGTDDKKSIWEAPSPELTKGKVLFSQTAEGGSESNDKPAADATSDAAVAANDVEPAVQKDSSKSSSSASCGGANGTTVSVSPAANLCEKGTPTTVIGSGPFMWTCEGADGATANCSALLQVDGVCGSADGIAVNAAPTSNLCRSGHASAVTGESPYTWNCAGAGSGVTATCFAPNGTSDNTKTAKATTPDVATKSKVGTAKDSTDCTPAVKRWTITCQQGGYPTNYAGVIVGETENLCPMNVERGVWLSNSCAPTTNSAPISKSPGKLEIPTPSSANKVSEMLPELAPMPADKLDAPRKLFTPHYKKGAGSASKFLTAKNKNNTKNEDVTTITFPPNSEGLDAQATNALEGTISEMRGDETSIITLNAYAATPADGNQQESRRVALARALAVRSYLMRKGMPSDRIDVRAIGPATDARGDDRVDIKIK